MNIPDRPRRMLAALAAALCLTACGGGGGGAEGAPAPTAWPQPVDGKLTDAMCDVLSADDFIEVGIHAMRWEERALAPDFSSNAIRCHALGGHFFQLNLQPDPVSGELYLRWQLDQIARERKSEAVAVPGADEGWFVTGADNSQLLARRGALLISMTVGFLHDEKDFDPRVAASTLAGQVLERLPEVGRVATGKPHEMVLTVTGKNTSTAMVIYSGPLDTEVTQETVDLPWTKTFQFPSLGRRGASINLSAHTTAIPSTTIMPFVSCVVTVDGAEEATGSPGVMTSCTDSFVEGG